MAPFLISRMWPHVAHLIETAFTDGYGDGTSEATKEMLDQGKALLWIAVAGGEQILAAATTQIDIMPNGDKVCLITACAGRDLRRWERFITELEVFAHNEGCDKLRVMGRRGWAAILKRHGYIEPWVLLEKAVG